MKSISSQIRHARSSVSPSQIALITAAIGIAVVSRLLPHPPNFTPLAAIGLFAGAISLRPAVAIATVLLAMLVSDAFLGFHSLMPVVYGCLLVNLMIGSRLVRGSEGLQFGAASCGRIVAGSLLGSVLFFLATNFAVFVTSYPTTGTGLLACYTAAIPFFQYTVTGDLAYSAVLFGAYALCTARSASPVYVNA
ncbi:DUF6580 family putative transport protein [Allorhodopirellula heiligendammensis]|uniref:Uncharacterized protein n=1 Tax=Allorhodopirellula heiligendammensis TaxID=2714739 RepID=A0A5C6BUS0_9BACT|nr:DUF6580 family putative transport protein [Allorhodopirellula heiligendammensis]TWU15785.1 hypothetical protein Poly21_29870 [Allorhodopirellula heiligendammensis]